MRAFQTPTLRPDPPLPLSAVAEVFQAPEGIANVQFIHIVASDPKSTGIDIHTESEVETVFFLLLWLIGESGRKRQCVGVFGAGQGRPGMVQHSGGKLIEEYNIKATGEKCQAFNRVERIGTL